MSADSGMVVGPLAASDRARVAEILRSTDNFRDEEIDVAVELFDESFAGEDYEFIGAYATSGIGTTLGGSSRESEHLEVVTVPGSRIPVPGRLPIPDSHLPGEAGHPPIPELVGFACYGPSPGTDRTYDLYWIAVDRSAQGSGCGTLLLAEVERRLEALHARMLVVETSSRSDYDATRGFYLRRGYVEAARVREFYAPQDDRIILTKRLAGSPMRGWGAVA